jgi:ATP-dependent DNA helicase RecG
MIPENESLTIEFKSDRMRLSDDELVEAAVGMANTDGGDLYIGVEDDGTPTGLHPEHGHPTGIAALIANRTIPPVSCRAMLEEVAGIRIIHISISSSRALTSTTSGKYLRRRMKADGTPENVAISPYEVMQRLSDLRLMDVSASPVAEASLDDLDPNERVRLRDIIERFHGERSLLDLADEELDGALNFTVVLAGRRIPTLTGMLCIGRESSLRRLVPTHEAAFQILEGTEVRQNDFFRSPLLKIIDLFLERFNSQNHEQEMEVGLFRVPIPEFDRRAFREALINAFTHRDYTILGTVTVQLTDRELIVSNPGGFVEGVTPLNLLTIQPSARNPYLADALKRIGLAERTGRGVDRIYEGMLRFGRPEPNYRDSTNNMVILRLARMQADMPFMQLIQDGEAITGQPLPIETIIALSALWHGRRLDIRALARAMQRDDVQARNTVERLVEAGLVTAHGTGRGRTYTVSPRIYAKAGDRSGYIRQAGFNAIQQEQMVLAYVDAHTKITRRDASDLCQINSRQASHLLQKLTREGKLVSKGMRRGVFYTRP